MDSSRVMFVSYYWKNFAILLRQTTTRVIITIVIRIPKELSEIEPIDRLLWTGTCSAGIGVGAGGTLVLIRSRTPFSASCRLSAGSRPDRLK